MTVDHELNSILIKCFYSGDWALIVWNTVTTQVCTICWQVSEIVLYLNVVVNLLESHIGNKTFKSFVDFESALNDFQNVRVILLAVILMYRLVEHYSKANVVKNHSTVLVYQNVCYRCVHYDDDVQPIVAALVSVKPKTEALREVLKGEIAIRFR